MAVLQAIAIPLAFTGQAIASNGSTISVFHKDAEDKSADPYNPYTAKSGAQADSANVVPHLVPDDATTLELFAEWIGTVPTGTLKVRVFGRVPRRPTQRFRNWPSDVNDEFAIHDETVSEESSSEAGPTVLEDEWVPLLDSAGNAAITIPLVKASTNGTSNRGTAAKVLTAGVGEVLVLIDDEATDASSEPSSGVDDDDKIMVVGRFVQQ